ncbi:hypothetical protein DFH08DRAFT_969345 [Mycena albidolilacea]|uniref:Ankyrin n=1 Tax=Mycena albidolilacea TaxID=1033008 RepID=A0AAD6ZHK0_9AGAR|nr:hypothetical protein DFH08DRAFT_969345 [Mycena albidolilacea]
MGAHCIPSNPNISGIGVRTAIYTQSLLCFAPDQSIGMLAVAFAILISTTIEARAKGGPMITSFYAAIILDLSWMNNTSMFIWLLLYAHHRSTADNLPAIPATWNGWLKTLVSPLRHLAGIKNKMDGDALGRNGSINLVVPFLIFIRLHILYNTSRRRHPGFRSSVEHPLHAIRSRISGTRTWDAESQNNSWLPGLGLPSPLLETHTGFLLVGLGCLAVINIIFVIDIELALARSKNPESQEDDEWGFDHKFVTLFQLAAYLGEVDVVRFLIDRVDINIAGGEYGTAINVSIANGKTEVVQLLLRDPVIRIDHVEGVVPIFERLLATNRRIEAARVVVLQALKPKDLRTSVVAMTSALQGSEENVRHAGLEGRARFIKIAEPLYFTPGWGHCTTGQLHPKLKQKLAEVPDRWIVDGNYGNRIGPTLQNQSTDVICAFHLRI